MIFVSEDHVSLQDVLLKYIWVYSFYGASSWTYLVDSATGLCQSQLNGALQRADIDIERLAEAVLQQMKQLEKKYVDAALSTLLVCHLHLTILPASNFDNTRIFYKQHYYKQLQAEIGKKLSKC